VPYQPRPVSFDDYEGWKRWLVTDQRAVDGRTDVLTYETPVLTEAVRISGAPVVKLVASTSGTDTDWVVKLIDVYPGVMPNQPEMSGYELGVGMDIFRGRYRESFENANLSALNALGNFNFAFAGEQGNGAHLAQIHADGVVGLFQRAGGEIKLNIIRLLGVGIELFFRGELGVFQDVDSLRADHAKQVVKIVGRVDVIRQEVIHLVIGEKPLFLAGIDQLLNIFVFIVESQEQYPSLAP